MNPAAKLVIWALAVFAAALVGTLCYNAVLTGKVDIVKDLALLVVGNLSGVLAKVGYDAAKPAVGPVENATVTVNPENPS